MTEAHTALRSYLGRTQRLARGRGRKVATPGRRGSGCRCNRWRWVERTVRNGRKKPSRSRRGIHGRGHSAQDTGREAGPGVVAVGVGRDVGTLAGYAERGATWHATNRSGGTKAHTAPRRAGVGHGQGASPAAHARVRGARRKPNDKSQRRYEGTHRAAARGCGAWARREPGGARNGARGQAQAEQQTAAIIRTARRHTAAWRAQRKPHDGRPHVPYGGARDRRGCSAAPAARAPGARARGARNRVCWT
jgi:hypothetical protein